MHHSKPLSMHNSKSNPNSMHATPCTGHSRTQCLTNAIIMMAEQVMEVVTANTQNNMDADDRAMLRLTSKQSNRTVSENATKLTYEVRIRP